MALSHAQIAEALAELPAAAHRLLRDISYQDYICSDLVGTRRTKTLDRLIHLGLLQATETPPGTYRFDPDAPAGPWYRPDPAVAAMVRAQHPLPETTLRRLWHATADWYRRHRMPGQAARALLAAGEPGACAEMLREHGSAMVIAGGAELASTLIRGLPAPMCDSGLRLVLGEALTVLGHNDAALAELDALAAEASSGAAAMISAALAWRLAAVHYVRGDREAALAAVARGRMDQSGSDGAGPRDVALLLAQHAIVRWSAGAEDCGTLGTQALQEASTAGDHQALAAAHVALALHAALVGDRAGNAEHYARGLSHAEAGRDAIQVARIHTNRVSLLLEEARYPEALAAAGPAAAAAEASGYSALYSVALINEAEAMVRLGRLGEAESRYQQAISNYQRTGSRLVAYPLTALGALHARRGERSLARAAFEEAIRAAEANGLQQGLIPALAGLAKVRASEDPVAAQQIATQAIERATGPLRTIALLAGGWSALAAGDRDAACAAAVAAAESARKHRDRAGLAEALELRAGSFAEHDAALDALREAERTWRATGSRVDTDRVAVLLGQAPSATAPERMAARLAQARLDSAGITQSPGPDGSAGWAGHATRVVIRALGRFEVQVAGEIIGASQWQSRKARDLLRILVSRRGQPIAREELCAMLWSDDDQVQRVSHRLSVALSTLRSVLDPAREQPADHYLTATPFGIGLNLAQLSVDVEAFLSEAELGLRLFGEDDGRQDDPADAHFVLTSAAQCYTGDFCADEPYEPWTAQTREEARAAYLRVIRALAEVSTRTGRVDEAAGHLTRALHLDPYDEQCHRDLVDLFTAAGRHGEARRANARYQAAMREIGLDRAGHWTVARG